MDLSILPSEIILYIYEQMDNQTLGRYLISGKEILEYDLCKQLFIKRKELESKQLIRDYTFSEPEFKSVYDIITKLAEVDNTLWKIISHDHDEFFGMPFKDLYFKGNLNRALLKIENYFRDIKNVSFLDYKLNQINNRVKGLLKDRAKLDPFFKMEDIRKNSEIKLIYIDCLLACLRDSLVDHRWSFLVVEKKFRPYKIL